MLIAALSSPEQMLPTVTRPLQRLVTPTNDDDAAGIKDSAVCTKAVIPTTDGIGMVGQPTNLCVVSEMVMASSAPACTGLMDAGHGANIRHRSPADEICNV